jgi:multidrug efflux system membrane fusion protein
MELNSATTTTRQLSRWVSIGILLAAIVLGLGVLYRVNHSPRTDDAEVFANFIGIAPQVEGPIVRLNVRDNQFVKKDELLYEIDERPYQYALERAVSEQAALEGQIADEQRKINALVSGVSVAKANISSSQADVARWAATVDLQRDHRAGTECL